MTALEIRVGLSSFEKWWCLISGCSRVVLKTLLLQPLFSQAQYRQYQHQNRPLKPITAVNLIIQFQRSQLRPSVYSGYFSELDGSKIDEKCLCRPCWLRHAFLLSSLAATKDRESFVSSRSS